MPPIPIASLDDERLLPYRNLRHARRTRQSPGFIVEGRWLVERLIASRIPLHSALVARRQAESISSILPSEVPLLVVPDDWVEPLVGFDFHRGVLAHAQRPANPTRQEWLPAGVPWQTVVVCCDVHNAENLGALLRTGSALGVDAVLLSPTCADPLSRRALRVSMGASLRLSWRWSHDLAADLDWLEREIGCELVAAVAQDDAESCADFPRSLRTALLVGNEAHGLSDAWLEHCTRRVTIPMAEGVDSLNVAVATGILLYELSKDHATTSQSEPAQKKSANQGR